MARRCTGRLEMRRRPWVAAVVLMLGAAAAGSASAQIATDGTMGPAQVLGGLDVTIPANLGTPLDGNLFHSFSDFNIATNGSATFDGPGAFANVISRVTGGAVSNIDGLLKSNIGTSGFFFINPAGVAFGPNASVNVPSAFHVSTADHIRFPDGGVFDATNPINTILSVADPSAFGFLSNNPASITVTGATLDVPAGQTLSLIGGGLTMAGGLLEAPSGVINLASVASTGEVSLAPSGPVLTGFATLGPIEMRDAARVSTRGDPGGTIYIRGGALTIDNSATGSLVIAINSGTTGATDGAPVGADIQVTGDVVLDKAEIVSSSFGAGRSGDVNVVAGRVQLVADESAGDPNVLGANIGSRVFGSGSGGDINITADSVELAANSVISTQVTFIGSGQAGDIIIDAGQVTIDGSTRFSFIDSSTFGAGSAGTIDINADRLTVQGGNAGFAGLSTQVGVESTGVENAGNISLTLGSLELHDSGQINASVFRGPGSGGTIDIVADTILIEGIDATGAPAGVFSNSVSFDGINFPSGDSGNVSVEVGALTLRDRGQISTFANSFGNSGSVDIIQADSVSVASGAFIGATSFGFGLAGPVTVDATSIELVGPSPAPLSPFDVPFTGIASLSGVIGAGGGTVTVTADQLTILDGAQINAQTTGLGDGGRVVVATDGLTISGFDAVNARPAGIVTDTSIFSVFSGFAVGRAGEIDITTTNLLVSDDGVVSSLSSSFGDAGSVNIVANNATFSGTALVSSASTLPGSAAAAGTLTIDAGFISILDDSQVSTSTASAGPAGTVSLTGDTLLVDNSTVSSSTTGFGSAGNVLIGGGSVTFTNEGRVTVTTEGPGDGGTIDISGTDLTLASGGQVVAQARSTGDAGDIVVAATGDVVITGFNDIDFPSGLFADSRSEAADGGDGGSITVAASRLDMSDVGRINARTFGGGNAGTVTLNVNELAVSSDAGIRTDTFGSGAAGSITANVDSLTLLSGGRVSSRSFGVGDGGFIQIQASTAVSVSGLGPSGRRSSISTEAFSSGNGGDIGIVSPLLEVTDSSLVVADSFADGRAGNIALQLGTLGLRDGGQVSSASKGAGDGGAIAISANAINILGGSGPDGRRAGIFGDALSSGSAGEISLNVGTLTLSDAGFITSGTSGAGNGGAILVVSGNLVLTSAAEISATTQGSGLGGDITIATTGSVDLSGTGTGIFAESASTAPDAGTAGNIVVSADTLQLTGGAEISTQSARADGGNIEIKPASFLLVQDSRITTSVGTGEGGGGNIMIGPVFFAILERGTIEANAFGGPGGNILIVANNFIATPDSIVEASSQLGINGTVRIESPDTDVSTGVVVLTESLMDAAARLAQQCGARGGRTLASFVGVGRGGLPVQPGAAMPSHYLAAGSGKLASGGADAVRQLAALPSGTVFVPATLQIACSV